MKKKLKKVKKVFVLIKKFIYLNIIKNKKTKIMITTKEIADQTKRNIDFLTSKEGWKEVKNILSMAAFNMNKKDRKEFFDTMKNEDKKRDFLIYLFSTSAIEASLIQTGVINK